MHKHRGGGEEDPVPRRTHGERLDHAINWDRQIQYSKSRHPHKQTKTRAPTPRTSGVRRGVSGDRPPQPTKQMTKGPMAPMMPGDSPPQPIKQLTKEPMVPTMSSDSPPQPTKQMTKEPMAPTMSWMVLPTAPSSSLRRRPRGRNVCAHRLYPSSYVYRYQGPNSLMLLKWRLVPSMFSVRPPQ